jgi:hypothetical protein
MRKALSELYKSRTKHGDEEEETIRNTTDFIVLESNADLEVLVIITASRLLLFLATLGCLCLLDIIAGGPCFSLFRLGLPLSCLCAQRCLR